MATFSAARIRARKQIVLVLLLTLGATLGCGVQAQTETLSEAQLRVRFLLNFMRFTEWPDGTFLTPDDTLKVCVLGSVDAFDGALATLDGAAVGSHRIEIRNGMEPDQAADCQLLFVPDTQLRRLQGVRTAVGHRAVLIVGESDAVLDRGGMIALRTVDRHLSFVVKLGTARETSLNFSPQMLRAAAEVLP